MTKINVPQALIVLSLLASGCKTEGGVKNPETDSGLCGGVIYTGEQYLAATYSPFKEVFSTGGGETKRESTVNLGNFGFIGGRVLDWEGYQLDAEGWNPGEWQEAKRGPLEIEFWVGVQTPEIPSLGMKSFGFSVSPAIRIARSGSMNFCYEGEKWDPNFRVFRER
jgi:hypothetical protein